MESFQLAISSIEQKNLSNLSKIVPSSLDPNYILKHYRTKNLSRSNVPLLCVCVAHKAIDCAKYLISNGSKVEIEDGNGYRPIHWACTFGYSEMLLVLLEAGACPDPISSQAVPLPISIASKQGFLECIRILIEKGVGLDTIDVTGRSLLHLASWFDRSETVQLLLEKGAKINSTDNAGHTPLHLAAWFGHLKSCDILIHGGADLNATDQNGRTPLHFACQHNRPAIVKLLIQSGANTKIKNCNGKTAEQIAVQEDRVEIVQIFQQANKEESKSSSNSDKSPELNFMEEHNKMKIIINSLVELRDQQVELDKSLETKFEKQDAIIQLIQSRHNELKLKIGSLTSAIQSALVLLDQIKPPPSSVAPPSHPNQGISSLCQVCRTDPQKHKCSRCHIAICTKCFMKYQGCPNCDK